MSYFSTYTRKDGSKIYCYELRTAIRQWFYRRIGHWQSMPHRSFKSRFSNNYFRSSDTLPIRQLIRAIFL